MNFGNDTDFSPFTYDYSGYVKICDMENNRQFSFWFKSIFFSITSIVGLVGNILVILTFFYFSRLKTMTEIYLLNLAFADMIFALTLPFWATDFDWVLGAAVCKAIYMLYKVTFYSGMMLLSLISLDRYFAITKAVSAHYHHNRRVLLSKVSSATTWPLAFIFSIPEIIYTTASNKSCSPYSSNEDRLRISIQITQIIVAFFIPLLVMSFCYGSMVYTLYQARSYERNKAIKVILAVVTVFLVSQMPYNMMLFWTSVVTAYGGTKDCEYLNFLIYATNITQCVAFLRCCFNPFIYAFMGVKFNQDFRNLLKDLGCVRLESILNRRNSTTTNTGPNISNQIEYA